jgi:hypothetical protein
MIRKQFTAARRMAARTAFRRRPALGRSISLFAFALASMTSLLQAGVPAESPFAPSNPGVTGQIRSRTELDGKAVADTATNTPFLSTQLRTRLAYSAATSGFSAFKLELQDARAFGSGAPAAANNPATASVSNSKGVDLLQGYALLSYGPFSAALGRQKMSLGSGRFLSTLEWNPVSRAFDGLSANYDAGPGTLTGLLYLVRDSAEKSNDDRALLTGLYYGRKLGPAHQADAYLFYDQSRLPSNVGGIPSQNHDLWYLGERLAGRFGPFAYEEEFIWQGGEIRAGRNVPSRAFQSSLTAGLFIGPHRISAGADVMSGDADPAGGSYAAYRANYYSAHAFFGSMDYFAVNPAHGVVDLRLDGLSPLWPAAGGTPRVTVKAQYHLFLPQDAPSGADGAYGQEADAEAHLGIIPKADIVAGAGLFLPGDEASALAVAAVNAGRETRPGVQFYLMPVFNF